MKEVEDLEAVEEGKEVEDLEAEEEGKDVEDLEAVEKGKEVEDLEAVVEGKLEGTVEEGKELEGTVEEGEGTDEGVVSFSGQAIRTCQMRYLKCSFANSSFANGKELNSVNPFPLRACSLLVPNELLTERIAGRVEEKAFFEPI